jgi:hypothetical protein
VNLGLFYQKFQALRIEPENQGAEFFRQIVPGFRLSRRLFALVFLSRRKPLFGRFGPDRGFFVFAAPGGFPFFFPP